MADDKWKTIMSEVGQRLPSGYRIDGSYLFDCAEQICVTITATEDDEKCIAERRRWAATAVLNTAFPVELLISNLSPAWTNG